MSRIVPPAGSSKFLSAAALAARRDWTRPLVFTNGVFDVLHRGHVTYLAQARALGKGPDRPLNNEIDRATVIAALQAVDHVVLFDEPTPCELIERLRPDVYVKGGDYDVDRLREAELVRSWGGRAVAIPFVAGYSTTRLVERIRKS